MLENGNISSDVLWIKTKSVIRFGTLKILSEFGSPLVVPILQNIIFCPYVLPCTWDVIYIRRGLLEILPFLFKFKFLFWGYLIRQRKT